MNYLTRSFSYGLCPLVKLLLGFSWIEKGGLFLNVHGIVYGTLVFRTESVDGKQPKGFYVVSYSDDLASRWSHFCTHLHAIPNPANRVSFDLPR